ncbi:MAG: LVIVD repeat-containing protein [Candidatus Dadabacteria bacterium]
MRNTLLTTFALAFVATSFLGCFKDTCQQRLTIYTPIYKTLSQVRAGMRAETPKPISTTGKMYIKGNYIYLNEPGEGIHIIDNTTPSSPKNISFIKIPGNVDLAVKNNYLYADSYTDIVVFDISDPSVAKANKFYDNVMQGYTGIYWSNQRNPDSVMVFTGYNKRDTVVDCSSSMIRNNCINCAFSGGPGIFFANSSSAAAPSTGVSGSMARLTITHDYLYAVSPSSLYAFDLADASSPKQTSTKSLGWNIETVYPFKDKLFIGSRTGMFIYDITTPSNPVQQGQFSHARSCDPVIADDNFAYVTLRSGTACESFSNQLDVLNISNVSSPSLVRTYPMVNPHGLSKDGNLLFICDGKDGLKIYNSSVPSDLQLVKTFKNIETFDVIAFNGIAVLSAKDGLYQFDYSDPGNIHFISHLAIN